MRCKAFKKTCAEHSFFQHLTTHTREIFFISKVDYLLFNFVSLTPTVLLLLYRNCDYIDHVGALPGWLNGEHVRLMTSWL